MLLLKTERMLIRIYDKLRSVREPVKRSNTYQPTPAAISTVQSDNYTYVTSGHGEDAHTYDKLRSVEEPVKRSNTYQPTPAAISTVQSDNYTYVTSGHGEDAHTYDEMRSVEEPVMKRNDSYAATTSRAGGTGHMVTNGEPQREGLEEEYMEPEQPVVYDYIN